MGVSVDMAFSVYHQYTFIFTSFFFLIVIFLLNLRIYQSILPLIWSLYHNVDDGNLQRFTIWWALYINELKENA